MQCDCQDATATFLRDNHGLAPIRSRIGKSLAGWWLVLLSLTSGLFGAAGCLLLSATRCFLGLTAGFLLLLAHGFALALGGFLLSLHGGFALALGSFLGSFHGGLLFELLAHGLLLGFGSGLLLGTHGGFLLLAFHEGGALLLGGFDLGLHGFLLLTLLHEFLLAADEFFFGCLLLSHGGFAGLDGLHLSLFAVLRFLQRGLHLTLFFSFSLSLLGSHGGFFGLLGFGFALLHEGSLLFAHGLGFLFLGGELFLHGGCLGLFAGEFLLLGGHLGILLFFQGGGFFGAHLGGLLFTRGLCLPGLLGHPLLHGGCFGLPAGEFLLAGCHGFFLFGYLPFTICLGFLHPGFSGTAGEFGFVRRILGDFELGHFRPLAVAAITAWLRDGGAISRLSWLLGDGFGCAR
jgi:hypothetical protein